MRARALLVVVLAAVSVLAVAFRTASAQVATGATPVYHGILQVARAGGSIDRDGNGSATVRVPRWTFLPNPDTNGIFPGQEVVNVAIGDEALVLDVGQLHPSRSGKAFSRRSSTNRIRFFRLSQLKNGAWAVRFTLAGIDLSRLLRVDSVCMPVAVLVGDDDGFTGATFKSPSFSSRRLVIPKDCDIGDDWPWLRG